MGLDNSKDESNNNQMSLFDYQLPKATFVANTSMDSYDWNFVHAEPTPNKIPRFVTMSAIVHAAAILLIAVLTVPLVDEIKTETITIELEDSHSPMQVSQGAPTLPTQGAASDAVQSATNESAATEAALPANLEVATTPEDIVVEKMLPKELPTKTLTVKAPAKTAAASKPKAESKVAKNAVAKTNFKAVPATIDDIDAPELEKGALAEAPVEAKLDDEDLNEDFAKVDHSNKAVLDDQKKSLEDMAAAVETEQNEHLSAVDQANKDEAERLENLQASLRQKNAAAVTAAEQADEDARAEAVAQQAAAAKAAQSAKAAQLAKLAAEKGQAEKAGNGAGNNGEQSEATKVAGAAAGVRSLDQLRQMPGNPRPNYDRNERRRGDQGEIAFVAYISKEGYPTKFKLMKSTGFRNLDSKTLAALKKWRFYPGQEGWVELPFRWDLKGGVQQDGGMLRREVVGSR